MSAPNELEGQKALLRKFLQERKISDPALLKILEDEIERGSGTEVYRFDDDGTGQPMYFNISAMREWAPKHCETFSFPPDMARAKLLVESGAVDPNHIRDYTIQTKMTPIIVCRGFLGGDQIVDGAHRFVAACMGAAMINMTEPFIPGYALQPAEWRPFIIPRATAEAYADYR